MRVAIFSEVFLPKVDGIVSTLCRLLEYLQQRGHEAILFAPSAGPSRYAGAQIVGLKSRPCPFYPELRLATPFCDVRGRLSGFRPDVVHVVNPFAMALAGMWQARELGLPIVASYHTDIPGFAGRWGANALREPLWAYFRWVHNQADLNLCPSRATLEELQERGFRRLRVWSRGVDCERFSPAHASPVWRRLLSGNAAEAPLLLYVGRLSPEKRVDWLRPVLDAIPEARLAIVGDGPARPVLEGIFAGTNTVFTGYLSGALLARAYAAADVFVFPAANETFGNVVLEAMASGLPVVVAAAGGPLDHVRTQTNGLLFDAESQDALIGAVRRLVHRPSFARELGRAGRAYAESRTWPLVLDSLMGDYESVAGRSGLLRAG